MMVLTPPGTRWSFDLGLIPGVVLGSFLAGLYGRELKLEGFSRRAGTMLRYVLGACLMGFGSSRRSEADRKRVDGACSGPLGGAAGRWTSRDHATRDERATEYVLLRDP